MLLEAGLRLAETGGSSDAYQDPLVGFSRVVPLFERDDDAGLYRTTRSRRVSFGEQEFAIEKPTDGYRIFCLGGSTVRGRPYTVETAFPRWLQLELSARDPGHAIEVINCGGVSYASYRLTHILKEVLTYNPDLIVIATGHNESLEDRTYAGLKHRSSIRSWFEDRLHQLRTIRLARRLTGIEEPTPTTASEDRTVLPEIVSARLDEVSGYASYHRDDAWAEDVRTHFDQSLRTMVDMCQAADVPALLVLLGSNLRDCPPFKSEHRGDITVEEERTWQTLVDDAANAEASDPETALSACESAAEIDDQHALLRFRWARLLDGLGRTDEASEHYLAAKDLDVCPLRMPEALATTLRGIAADTQTPLVDARGRIESKCAGGLAGNDWYMDHVHPSIGAHQEIAAAIASQIPIALNDWSEQFRRRSYDDHLQSLGPVYLTNGHERVSWLEKWARRQRLLRETLPQEPVAHLRYGDRLWDFGLQDAAWEHYQTALQSDTTMTERLLDRSQRLYEQGRTPEARQLVEHLADSPYAPAADVLEPFRTRFADPSPSDG